MYNILVGGAAGQGIETTAAILEKLLKKSGYNVFTIRDFMSRVRGGHNFSLVRFGSEEIFSHTYELDGIIAFNDETIILHKDQLKADGFILCGSQSEIEDPKMIKIDMMGIARSLGNFRAAGSVAIGTVLKLFGESLDHVNQVFKQFVKEDYLEVNLKAAEEGYQAVEAKYAHIEGKYGEWMILSGNKALALGALAAGLRFYSAYPMSPSTTIMEYLAGKSVETGIVVEQAEDEIAAVNMAIGASFAGARAMTGTSGGGFALKVEALGLSGMAEIPLVIVDVQRPGPVTGLPTRTEQSDLKFVISASQGEFPRMVIAVRNHKDAFYQTIRAFEMAEKYQLPVIILSDQYIGDSSATVEPFNIKDIPTVNLLRDSEIEGEYLRYRFSEDGISKRLIPGRVKHFVTADSDEHDEKGWITESAEVRVKMMDKRLKKLELLKEKLEEPEFLGAEDFTRLVVAWGSVYGPLKEAIELINKSQEEKYGALVFGDIYPLPQKVLREKAARALKIINVEQNATGQLADLIKEQTGITCDRSILKYDGRQITAKEIIEKML
ncbi:2-oxoacid:acceptor oxidoreductase subunit alpha [Cellulosilyticum sp. I15G10I2]|uniref:2-oxoacid:acceptor oxidoreductase subunit alpha n=1 Tax=Cellulosilyticum sp. I15G10I2 TaxID=1892843 RepID=UPI00085BB1DB|nr:2-oxoacid:acceptor oxidoreductase subunit alpha [Cellulosilyticum sp. I15G10I2]